MRARQELSVLFMPRAVLFVACALLGYPPTAVADESDDLAFRVLDTLRKNCVACHRSGKTEGGVSLDTVDDIRDSDYDDLVVSGNAAESRLYVVAAHEDEPVMPPANNNVSARRLTSGELTMLRRWIDAGAEPPKASRSSNTASLRPIAPSNDTTYATAVTADGRLTAASFGNRIAIYGEQSERPVQMLRLARDDDSAGTTAAARGTSPAFDPPHQDFVQALAFADHGRTVISAGYRNIKIWKAHEPTAWSLPAHATESHTAVGLSPDGRHVATWDREGRVSAWLIGTETPLWETTWNEPSEPTLVRVAIATGGDKVAIATESSVTILSDDQPESEFPTIPAATVSMRWASPDSLLVAFVGGGIQRWVSDGKQWNPQPTVPTSAAISLICPDVAGTGRILLIADDGSIFTTNDASQPPTSAGKLSAKVQHAIFDATRGQIMIAFADGTAGTYDLENQTLAKFADRDAAAAARLAQAQWDVQVGDRLVVADEADLKSAVATRKAEEDNVAKIDQEITSKEKASAAAKDEAAKAKQAFESANADLEAARKKQTDTAAKRVSLTTAIEQDKSDEPAPTAEKGDTPQPALTDARKANEAALAALPTEKALAADVTAKKAIHDKAEQASQLAEKKLAAMLEGLELAKQANVRSETYLTALTNRVKNAEEQLTQAKASRDTLAEDRTQAAEAASAASAAPRNFAWVANGLGLSHSPTSGWSCWSTSGDWLYRLDANTADLASAKLSLIAAAGRTVLCQSESGAVTAYLFEEHCWSHATTIGSVSGKSPFSDRVLCMDVDSTGQLLATGGGLAARHGEVHCFDLATGQRILTLHHPQVATGYAHRDSVFAVKFSPDGSTLATAGADEQIHLWDVASGRLAGTLEGHNHHVTSIDWQIAGRQLASGASDGTIRIWDIAAGKSIREITTPAAEVTGLRYVSHEDRIVVSTGKPAVSRYLTGSGRREWTNAGLGAYVYSVAGSRDGRVFCIGGLGATPRRIDRDGKLIQTLVLP